MIAAAVKLGLVEANELDEEETRDLVTLAAQGMIEDPESRLGRYLVRNWERVALVGGESLVYWLRKLVFRGAWLDHQVKRGALEIVWDDVEAEFAYQHPGGGRPLLELAPGAVVARAAVPRVKPWGDASRAEPAALPRSLPPARRPAGASPAAAAGDGASHAALRDGGRRVPRGAARGRPLRVVPAAARARRAHLARARRLAHAGPGAAARADARRDRLRHDRRGHRLADLGPLHLPPREPAAVRAARRTGSSSSPASRSRSRSPGTHACSSRWRPRRP